VHHKQLNFAWRGTKRAVLLVPLLLSWPVLAGPISQPSRPDPLLDGGDTDPCAASVDYAPAMDVHGHGVIPADVDARPVPVPDSIAIPLGRTSQSQNSTTRRRPNPARNQVADTASNRDSSYIVLDGRKLEPLLNSPPCGAVH